MSRFALAFALAGCIAAPATAAPMVFTASGTFPNDGSPFAGQSYSASLTYDDANIVAASSPTGTAFAIMPSMGLTPPFFGDVLAVSVSFAPLGANPVYPGGASNLVTYTNGQPSLIILNANDQDETNFFQVTASFLPDTNTIFFVSVTATKFGEDDFSESSTDMSPTFSLAPAAVPEPATMTVFGMLAAGGAVFYRRRNADALRRAA